MMRTQLHRVSVRASGRFQRRVAPGNGSLVSLKAFTPKGDFLPLRQGMRLPKNRCADRHLAVTESNCLYLALLIGPSSILMSMVTFQVLANRLFAASKTAPTSE
jgi:hypothetical protein